MSTTMVATIQSPRERELRGHGTRRLELPMQHDSTLGPNPSGLCMCGCGCTTTVATHTEARQGITRGQHRRFIHGHHARGVTGSNHSQWKSGRIVLGSGHVTIHVGVDHPMATSKGYVAEHRLVMADHLGRYLLRSELVHHIDLNPTNNELANLVVVTRSQHGRIHRYIDYRGMDPVEAVRLVLGDAT